MPKRLKERNTTQGIAELARRLNQQFGAGTALFGSDLDDLHLEFFSTGCFALDVSLRGGFAYNRITELIGQESTCKSTLMALASRQFLSENPEGIVLYGDMENAVDFDWMRKLGCNLSKQYIFAYADSGEQAGDIFDAALAERTIPVMAIVDSIMALVPENELEATMDSHFVGQQPALINRIIRVCNARLKSAKVGRSARVSVILVNQTRPQIGGFGPPQEGSSGGQARKFFTGQRIQLSTGSSKDLKREVDGGTHKITTRFGRKVNYQIIKNKCGGPEETGHFLFYPAQHEGIPLGIDNAEATVNNGLVTGVLTRAGFRVVHGRQVIGTSTDDAVAALRKDAGWCTAIQTEIMAKVRGEGTPKMRVKLGGKYVG